MDTQGLRKIGQALTKSSPTLLTGLGIAGVLSTAVMAVRATPKALALITEEAYDRYERTKVDLSAIPDEYEIIRMLSNKDIVKLTWKCYLPATIMGVLTIVCIAGSNSINLRRNAALASVYSLSEAALKEYQTKVVETIGKNKDRKIKDDIAKDKLDKNPIANRDVVLTGKGDTLCYEALSGRYFKSDIQQIRKALNDVGRDMLSDMFVPLNDVYYALDLPGTKMGDLIGWNVDDGLIEPDFSSQLMDGIPVLVIDYVTDPRYIYMD